MTAGKQINQNTVIFYAQPDGRSTALDPLSVSNHGVGDKTIPRAGREIVPGRNVYGQPIIKTVRQAAVSGLLSMNIEWEKHTTPPFLEKMSRRGSNFGLWEFAITCGRLDNLSLWDRLDFWGNLGITQEVQGGGPSRDGAGTEVVNNVDASGVFHVVWVPWELAAQTTTETETLLCIDGLGDLIDEECVPGYPGPDKILYIGCEADSLATPNVLYTTDGGSTWAAMDTDPFAADEHVGDISVFLISPTQYRVIAYRSVTDGAAPAECAYQDITIGSPAGGAWTAVNIGSTNGEYVTAEIKAFLDRQYVGLDSGDIFMTADWGESWTNLSTDTDQINAFAVDKNDSVWAVGASNAIKREDAKSGVFNNLTGPSGGGAFTAIHVANDMTVYAGNGQSIYKSSDRAGSTGNWTQLKDFGANHTVQAIHCPGGAFAFGGESQLVQALVTDGTGNDGDVWYSFDGGNTWREVTDVTNPGYNAWYRPEYEDNEAIIVGVANATPLGTIHKLQPKVT